jgi:hypothetical protein
MVVGRQEGKRAKVASACVIAVRKFRPSGILGEKVMSSAQLTKQCTTKQTSNSVRLLHVCIKQLLAPLSAIILILSWFLCVLHFTQFDNFEEHLSLQKSSTLLSRLLKLLNSCDFSSLVRVQTV